MSWFFIKSKGPAPLPPPTALQTQRSRQIEALKCFNQNIIELQRDVEYRLNITVYGATVGFHINLPPSFPQEPPVIKVSPPLLHPWVNEHMLVTGCSALNSFNMHSDLGRIVRQLVDEFQLNPPTLKPTYSQPGQYPYHGAGGTGGSMTLPTSQYDSSHQQPQPAYQSTPSPLYSPSTPSSIQPPGTPLEERLGKLPQAPPYLMPDLPDNFPELEKMTISELEELSKDDSRILSMILVRPECTRVQEDMTEIRTQNEILARENLSKQPEVEIRKEKLLERFDEMTDVRRTIDGLLSSQEQLRSDYLAPNIHTRLQISMAQAEEESDNIAEMFMEGKMDIDEFKKQFIPSRKIWYSRRAKEERYQSGTWR